MTVLVGADGQHYDATPDAVAKAIASGQFRVATSESAPESITTVAPSTGGSGADSGGVVVPGAPAPAAVKPDIQDIPLIGEDGQLYDSPDDKVAEAVATGKFRVSTLEERQAFARDQAERARVADTGPIEAAALGVARHIPFADLASSAIAGAISGKGTREELAQSQRDADLVSEVQPVAYGAGAVGGEVAGAVGGGALAGGISKAAGLSGVARAAAEGAIFSAEPVAKAIVNKDPAASAEALALGIGLNITLHGAFGAIAKLPGAAAEGAEAVQGAIRTKLVPEMTEQEAENLVGRKSGLTTKEIADNQGKIAPAFKLAGITAEDFAEGRHIPKLQALDAAGPEIGKAIAELDTVAEKAPIIEEHLANASSEIRSKLMPPQVVEHDAATAAVKAAGSALREATPLVKEAATYSERLAAREAVSEATERLGAARARLAAVGKLSPLAEEAVKTLGPILRQIEATAERGTFGGIEGTQHLKKWVADATNFTDSKGVNVLRRRAAGIIAENVTRGEDAVAEQLGSSSAVEGLRKQRALYAISSLFGDAADKVAARAAPEHLGHLLGGPSTGSGHMLPHFVLGALGLPSGVNAALAITGVPQMVKGYIEKQRLRGAAAKLLGESTAPATNTLVHALERQKLELSDSVKGFFSALGTREAEKALDTSGGLRGFTEDANGRSHGQQLATVQRLVTQAQTDPAATAARLDHVVAPLRAEGLHEVAQAYTDHQLRLLKVLQAILPSDPDSIAKAHPFAARVSPDEIAPATKARYQRALTIAANPTALLHLVRNNQINAGDVAVAAAVNPSTLQKLRDEVVAEGMKTKPDLTYQQRLSMGILLGQHIDASTEQIPQMQAAYAGAASAAPTPGPHRSGKLSSGARNNLAGAPLTLSQHGAGHSR